MNKRTLLAFALSFIILISYPLYIKAITPPGDDLDAGTESATISAVINEAKTSEAVPSINIEKSIIETPVIEDVDVRLIELENDLVKILLSSNGAGISSLSL